MANGVGTRTLIFICSLRCRGFMKLNHIHIPICHSAIANVKDKNFDFKLFTPFNNDLNFH